MVIKNSFPEKATLSLIVKRTCFNGSKKSLKVFIPSEFYLNPFMVIFAHMDDASMEAFIFSDSVDVAVVALHPLLLALVTRDSSSPF